MRDIKTFLASSTVELARERVELGNYIRSLDEKFAEYGYHFRAVMCEDMSHAVTREGSQAAIDGKIPDCQFFVLLAGKELGRYTEGEFDLALKEFQEHHSPKIYTCFRRVPEEEEGKSIARFKRRLRGIGSGHYWQNFGTLVDLELNLTQAYMKYAIGHKPDAEFNRDMYRKGKTALTAREKLLAAIADNRRKAAELARRGTAAQEGAQSGTAAQGEGGGTTPDIFLFYEEIVRLAKHYLAEGGAYREELEALYDYAHFLHRHGMDARAILIGNLLDGAYNPDDGDPEHWDNQAAVKNLLAECHMARGKYEKAEPLYREALELYRRLEKEDPDAGADIAETCGALAEVLKRTYRYSAAARLYREALARYREFALAEAEGYAPALLETCENLALFLSGRMAVLMEPPMTAENFKLFRDCVKAIDDYVEEPNPRRLEGFDAALGILKTLLPYLHFPDEGKRLFHKAEEAVREGTKDKPYQYDWELAAVCNHWGTELYKINRMEAAETLYRQDLKISRKLAQSDSVVYEPDLAKTCNNLANLLSDANRPKEAEKFYREALEIYRKSARDNPVAYGPYVAGTCFNLGMFELEVKHNPASARALLEEAEALFQKYPYLEEKWQEARRWLFRAVADEAKTIADEAKKE